MSPQLPDEYREDRQRLWYYLSPYLRREERDPDGLWIDNVCSFNENPTDDQRALARVLHWLRNKKKDLSWCIARECYPGPRGHMKKGKGIWMPEPEEACLKKVEIRIQVQENQGKKGHIRYDPYAFWRHCKTYEHCLYMIMERPRVTYLRLPVEQVSLIGAALLKDCVPLLAGIQYDRHDLVQDFFKDWCTGNVPDNPAEEDGHDHQDDKVLREADGGGL